VNVYGEIEQVIGTIVDITDLKEVQIELETANKSLEQFAYVASHDLQEPLRKIRIFSDLVQNNIDESSSAKLYSKKISESATRMQHLIESILEY
jgi:light-regulated signal transduction histidine kinase (bacteriophytochrome)